MIQCHAMQYYSRSTVLAQHYTGIHKVNRSNFSSYRRGWRMTSSQVQFAEEVSFCGLKCTTFLRVKVYHPEMLTFMI
jgi:hypothetical protein